MWTQWNRQMNREEYIPRKTFLPVAKLHYMCLLTAQQQYQQQGMDATIQQCFQHIQEMLQKYMTDLMHGLTRIPDDRNVSIVINGQLIARFHLL